MKSIYEYLNRNSIKTKSSKFTQDDRFWIEAVSPVHIYINRSGTPLHISSNGVDWINCSEFDLNDNDRVYVYIDTERFGIEGQYKIGGNLLGLYTTDAKMDNNIFSRGNSGVFRDAFSNTGVVDASLLVLPELHNTYRIFMSMFGHCKHLKAVNKDLFKNFSPKDNNQCCLDMFGGCTSLEQAPDLPKETSELCYCSMFGGCTSLRQAPKLPATQLAESCYYGMFEGCTSLRQAPDLPATQLVHECYKNMFINCTSLRQAPDLPATQLAESCYNNMFSGCTSLRQAPDLPATQLAESCYNGMFINCTSLRQSPDLPATQLAENCYNNMFSGCTSLTQASELPATQLADKCYYAMYGNCKSLTQAPKLPAKKLEDDCYSFIFYNCTSLNSIEIHADPVYSKQWKRYGDSWMIGCSRVGTIKKDSNFVLPSGGKGIPAKWTTIDI